jgi:peptidyl-prolyl cis-trans isomerase B (cyclophilin B)
MRLPHAAPALMLLGLALAGCSEDPKPAAAGAKPATGSVPAAKPATPATPATTPATTPAEAKPAATPATTPATTPAAKPATPAAATPAAAKTAETTPNQTAPATTPATPSTPAAAPAATPGQAAADTPAAATQETPVPATAPAANSDPAIAQIDAFIAEKKVDKSKPSWRTSLTKPPKATFTAGKTYTWVLNTNQGEIRVKLLPDVAPMHVSSTIYLTNLGFYDGLAFHRVITGFMAQGGCPLGSGTGGPGYEYAGEFSPNVKHDKAGKLSMANRGPGTDGSQFFLTFLETPHLDGKHSIFGEVSSGMDVVKKLEAQGSGQGTPKSKLTIDKATIVVE